VRDLFNIQFKLTVAVVMAVVFVPLSGTLYYCMCEGRVAVMPEPPAKSECCADKNAGDDPESCPKPCYEPVQMVMATPAEFGCKSQDTMVFAPPLIFEFPMEQQSMGIVSKTERHDPAGQLRPLGSGRLHLRLRVLLI
jgi:hypothetical protein